MATSNALDESESDAQRDHSRAVRLLRGTRYKCATGWRLLERILFLLWGKLRWLLYHRRFLWQVVMAALGSRGAKFIPSLEGRGFLWQFCKSSYRLLVRHEVAISTVILEFMRSPCVLPQVPYRDVRRRQRRGAKLLGQYNFSPQGLVAESRE